MNGLIVEKNNRIAPRIDPDGNLVFNNVLKWDELISDVDLKSAFQALAPKEADVLFMDVSQLHDIASWVEKVHKTHPGLLLLLFCDEKQEKEILPLVSGSRVDYLVWQDAKPATIAKTLLAHLTFGKVLEEKERDIHDYRDRLQLEISERLFVVEALRESVTRFRNIAMSITGWIWEVDESGLITYSSGRVEDMLGFDADDVIGKPYVDFLDEAINPASDWEDKIRQQGEIHEIEAWYRHKNGQRVCVISNGVPVFDNDRHFKGYRGVNRDITLRKIAEEEMTRLNEELERSNQDLEQFAYVASHDLQEPLRMITSYLQLLEKRYKNALDEDAHTFIDYAVNGATRMQTLIKDLLAFSRVRTQGKPFEPVTLNEVVDRVLSDLKFAIRENSATVTRDDLPEVQGDPGQIGQVFQNLISNALKFRSDAAPEIHIAFHENGRGRIFSVEDNGIGIAPEFHERIFNMFQRLHTQNEYRGTGIGLSICKKIVERHHGAMWVESEPGQGTRFLFTLS